MSEDEDDYVTFGKHLKEIVEGETIRKRPISVEEQIVTDENGKRRFHGAFTGGFSAGFFNTVDTPQGWVPAQFKSSRGDRRTEAAQQRPEDFMDAEDLGDFGFATQGLRTKSSFQSKTVPAPAKSAAASLLGPAVEQLVQPTRSTVGEQLLMRQGWKPGQGIGPKVSRSTRTDRMQSYQKTYGATSKPAIPEEEEDEDPLLEQYKEFLFAPDELPVYVAAPKDNCFGIGYRGLERGTVGGTADSRAASDGTFSLRSGVAKKKFSISGEAFGVGVYEEDDEDVYNRNDLGQYDFAIDVASDGARKASKPQQQLRALSSALEGFSLATTKSSIKKHFEPPAVPRDWRPSRTPLERKSRFEPAPSASQAPPPSVVKNTNPTRDQRRAVLFPEEATETRVDEKKTAAEDKAVALPDFLLADLATTAQGDARGVTGATEGTAFRPFATNAEKQKRYDQYLACLRNGRKDALKLLQPKSMTEWERERERVEFERAAMLYQPMKAVISSRFVSAGSAEDEAAKPGLAEANPQLAEKAKAAQMKMFGGLTRETAEWVPARLLCVRFNVKNPFADDKEVAGVKKKKTPSFDSAELFSKLNDPPPTRRAQADSSSAAEETPSTAAPPETTTIKDEETNPEKPSMDLFKAIFANSDSEDEEDGDDEIKEEKETTDSSNAEKNLEIGAKSGPSEAPRGIFANIDFDALNRRRPRAKSPPPLVKEKVATTKPKSVLDQSVRTLLGIKSPSDEEYGPALPPPLPSASKSILISSDSDSEDGWVVKSEAKKKKKKKKEKKHKKEKKKKKHKSRRDD